MDDASYWISRLGLARHPEGGYFRETYRAAESMAVEHLPRRFCGGRAFSTAIYYLLRGDDFSSFHRILSDELWHFYAGSSLFIHCLNQNGSYSTITLGRDPDSGESFQAIIPAGTWFASEIKDKKSFSLAGCTVSPGFDFSDFTLGSRKELAALFPEAAPIIQRLTRE